MEFIFSKNSDRMKRHTKVTSLPEVPLNEVRRVMPTIIVGDDFVGVSPMVGPTPETWELVRQLNTQKENPNAS